jgi:hypothetical protein
VKKRRASVAAGLAVRYITLAAALFLTVTVAIAQSNPTAWPSLTQEHNYVVHRSSSYDRTGGNDDWRSVAPGATITILNADGPGVVSHIWMTINDQEAWSLKKIVLRMYWDGEKDPSVEAPVGDFFGLGLGDYYTWHSAMLSVAPDKALNSFFPMPFQHHARITITNQGSEPIHNLYWNIDYRAYPHPLPPGTLYFHAEYHQAQPTHGIVSGWNSNGDAKVLDLKNKDGKDNYVFLNAEGRGQFVGVTMSVLQNQDDWFGEGDDMFFIDGEKLPSINGTGTEDYFLGAWGFGDHPFSYPLYGAPYIEGDEHAGARISLYRFHLDAPITFTKSIRATIEHGHGNSRSDNFYSVAYWYQTQPHAPLPALPPAADRIPELQPVGGPGNNRQLSK